MGRRLLWAGAAVFCLSAGALFAGQSNDDCLTCHGDPGLKAANGRPVFVNDKAFQGSAHGQAGLSCIVCHADLKGVKDFPHAEKLKGVNCAPCHAQEAREVAASIHAPGRLSPESPGASCVDCHGSHDIRVRDDPASTIYHLNLPATCEKCHGAKVAGRRGAEFIKSYETSEHFRALTRAGLTLAADCADCHGGHLIRAVADPRSRISRKNVVRTCGACHAGMERDYLEGVHGQEYLRGGKDVPVCTDCHSEHAILSSQDVRSTVYATRVAAVCSRCHDSEALSKRYGFRLSSFMTFGESFHGVAARSGRIEVANCASCHGFHNIRPARDPRSSINPANLDRTCGRCHGRAGRNFARGRIHVAGGQASSPAKVLRALYTILIIAVVAVSLLFIAADLWGRLRGRGTE